MARALHFRPVMTSGSISPPPPVAQATVPPSPAASGPAAALVPGFAAMLLPVAGDAGTGLPTTGIDPAAEEGGTGAPPDGNVVPLASPWLPPVTTVQPLPPGAPGVLAGRLVGTKQDSPATPAAVPPPAIQAAAPAAAQAASTDGTDAPAQPATPQAATAGSAQAVVPPALGLEGAESPDTATPAPIVPLTADPTESAVEPRLARFVALQDPGAGPGPEGDTEARPVPVASRDAAVEPAPTLFAAEEGEPSSNTTTPSIAAGPPTPPARMATPAAVMQLATPVGAEPFPQELGERVAWMVGRDLTSAQLKLNPPQLGPVEVRVQVSGDQASVSLSAHNFVARDALEQAIPRLRDMLGAQGFTQVDVNVAQHSFQERPAQPGRYDRDDAALAEVAMELPVPSSARSARAAMTLVDTYA